MDSRRALTLAMGALALTFGFCAKVGAQQPAATLSAGPSPGFVNPLPLKSPGGWDPKFYAAFRERCGEIWQKQRAGMPLTRPEFTESDTCRAAIPISCVPIRTSGMGEAWDCRQFSPGVWPPVTTREPPYPQRQFHNSPLPTPVPQPQSSNDAPSGDPGGAPRAWIPIPLLAVGGPDAAPPSCPSRVGIWAFYFRLTRAPLLLIVSPAAGTFETSAIGYAVDSR